MISFTPLLTSEKRSLVTKKPRYTLAKFNISKAFFTSPGFFGCFCK